MGYLIRGSFRGLPAAGQGRVAALGAVVDVGAGHGFRRLLPRRDRLLRGLRAHDDPDPNKLATAQTSVVYYSDGKTEIGRFQEINRTSSRSRRSRSRSARGRLGRGPHLLHEQGRRPPGIARAFWNDVHGGATQGGSTITQQYVKNYLPDPAAHAVSARSRRSSSRSRSTGSPTRTRSCRTTSTPSTSAAAPTASRRRARPTSATTSAS